MFELSEERLLMISDDHSIRLTTHRVIQETADRKNQVMLEDYTGYAIRKNHIGNYKTILIIISVLFIISVLERLYSFNDQMFVNALFSKIFAKKTLVQYIAESPFFWLFLVLLLISIHFYVISRRYYLQINGKYNSIEFRITNPNKKSTTEFLNRLEKQVAENKKSVIV